VIYNAIMIADATIVFEAAPKLNVVTVNQAFGLLDCFGIVGACERLKSNEMSRLGSLPSGLFQRPQIAGKELGDLRGPQRAIAIAGAVSLGGRYQVPELGQLVISKQFGF
jgi:hypothetical protein